jgi:carbon monoxide dehydrogenase subunit G
MRLMALTWHASIVIPAPIEAVWAVVADPGRDPEWRGPWVTEVVQLTDGPLTVGTRYETRYVRGRSPSRTEITAHEPPRRLGWQQVGTGGGTVSSSGQYALEPAGEGTRMSVEIHGEFAGLARFAGPLVTWYTNRFALPGQLRRLREVVLRGASDEGPGPGR